MDEKTKVNILAIIGLAALVLIIVLTLTGS